MADILTQENDDGKIAWYLNVIGKGGRTRQIYLVKPALAALQTYLIALGLAEDPRLSEPEGRIISYRKWQEGNDGQGQWIRKGVFHTVVYADIKRFLGMLAREIEGEAPFDAQAIRKISPHWLRHTFASMLVKTTPLAQVRDMLGHSSINTTSLYLGTEKEEGEKGMEQAFE